MLQLTLRVIEQRTDCANSRPLRLLYKFGEPACFDNFNVVIEKKEELSIGLASAEIIQARPIEVEIALNYGQSLFNKIENPLGIFPAAIIEHDHFEIRIVCKRK